MARVVRKGCAGAEYTNTTAVRRRSESALRCRCYARLIKSPSRLPSVVFSMKRSSKPNDLLRPPIKTKTLFSQQVDAETLSDARQAALACKACDLWKRATQTVF